MADRPAGLVVDLAPIQAWREAIEALEAAWANVPAVHRPKLTQLLWLHPSGELVVYAAPDGPVPDPDPSEG